MRSSGRYEIERTLGRGGMATVYLARDNVLGRHIALKVLAEHLADDETFRARFLREARLAARISHPNVVRVYDAGEDEHGLAIALEYVEGETLAEEIARRGRLPAGEVAALGLELAAALAAAHEAGLVHRDVKPQNVLRAAGGTTTKLGDFGIARSHDSTALTQDGSVLGTAAYLAPEQARGEPVTGATDLYALGVVLYQALTGRLPHEGSSLAELVLAREQDAPAPPGELVGGVPPALEAAIVHCLAARPDDRPPSAAALAAELETTAPGATVPLPRVPAVPAASVTTAATAVLRRPRRPLALGVAAALAALAAAGALVAFTAGGSPEEQTRAATTRSAARAPAAQTRPATTAPPATATPAAATPAASQAPSCAELERERDRLEEQRHALDELKKGRKGKGHKNARKEAEQQKKELGEAKKELDRRLKDTCR